MANIKITDLTAYGDPTSTDVLPIVDVGADVTKKVSVADLLENAGSGTESLPGIAFDGDPNTGIYRPGADQLAISTNGAERIRFASDGNVGIGAASPAVACDVVGQVRASTGILFGSDTAAANALDDYEEGTWTPTIITDTNAATSGITTSGTYTKVGDTVTCFVEITFSASSTISADTLFRMSLPVVTNVGGSMALSQTGDVGVAAIGYISGGTMRTLRPADGGGGREYRGSFSFLV